MKRLMIAIMVLLVIGSFSLLRAQEATPEQTGWPIEQQCVGEPTKPPEGWTFDGTILMTGYAGIHGVNADWETPRVVAAGDPWIFRAANGDGSAGLSPDKRWYATFDSETIPSETYNHLDVIHAIAVYSTVNRGEVYRIPWDNSWLYMWGPRGMFWSDNSHLIYETGDLPAGKPVQLFVINPFDGTALPWEGKIPLTDFHLGWPSFSYEIQTSEEYPAPDFSRTVQLRPPGIYDIMSGEKLADVSSVGDGFTLWTADSARFVTEVENAQYPASVDLAIFDRDGALVSIIFTADPQQLNGRNAGWSPDGRYLAFLLGAWDHLHLYIADSQQQKIWDTCLDTGHGVAWSPDSKQLAFFMAGEEQERVVVMDVETQAVYTVAHHIATQQDYVIGWRGD